MTTRLLPLVLTVPLFAGEVTLESGPFRVEHQFDATAIPPEPSLISLKPESWSSFIIETILDHGSEVKAGDVLITLESEDFQRRLEDLTRSLAKHQLDFKTAELDSAKLKTETELKLEAARRRYEQAVDDLEYFKQTGRPAEEAELEKGLKQSQFRLDAEKEELAQLKQMYEEDDLTEATEEIILKRQIISIEMAQFSLAETKRRNERTRTSTLPRRQETLERGAKSAAIELEKAEANLPRALKKAELELQETKAALEREELELKRLKRDEALLEIKAPTDGIFFHGSLENGRWELGDLAKALVEKGKLPSHRVIASIAPAGKPLPLSARLDPAISAKLVTDTTVSVTLAGREDLQLIGKISNPPGIPGRDGKDTVTISVEWPGDLIVNPATSATCLAVVYQKDDALSVPVNALQAASDGTWSVELKMAEGETQRRTIERGRANTERVEITAGLEPGQVIVVPD